MTSCMLVFQSPARDVAALTFRLIVHRHIVGLSSGSGKEGRRGFKFGSYSNRVCYHYRVSTFAVMPQSAIAFGDQEQGPGDIGPSITLNTATLRTGT